MKNVGLFLLSLKNLEERKSQELSQESLIEKAQELTADLPQAEVLIFGQPAIPGLGTTNGLDFILQSRQKDDAVELENVMNDFIEKLSSTLEVLEAFSSYTANTPHVFIDFDRLKAQTMGIAIGNVFDTLQAYFGTFNASKRLAI